MVVDALMGVASGDPRAPRVGFLKYQDILLENLIASPRRLTLGQK